MLLLSRSFRRKLLATVLAACGFVLLYDATVIDLRSVALRDASAVKSAGRMVGARLTFIATAYCKGQTTSAGVSPQSGIAAADPQLLPEGSVVRIDGGPERYRGIYTVMDTGPKVVGQHLDLYMWSCMEASTFGRRQITLSVLRLGWNPKNSAHTTH
jgi:3D (Asp-Asp-Asp) domain-containing protein